MNTRASRTRDLDYIVEIEKVAWELRKRIRLRKERLIDSEESEADISIPYSLDFEEEIEEAKPMAVRERTLKELAAPDINQQPLCIAFPALATGFELKPGLIHLLPIFRGLAGEDPHKHLKEFHVVCSTFKPNDVTEGQIKLRAFSFLLGDKDKDWLYDFPEGSIGTWDEVKRSFLEKFFPASRAANIMKEICGFRQFSGENLHEYWERFKHLCASCPHH